MAAEQAARARRAAQRPGLVPEATPADAPPALVKEPPATPEPVALAELVEPEGGEPARLGRRRPRALRVAEREAAEGEAGADDGRPTLGNAEVTAGAIESAAVDSDSQEEEQP